MANILKNNWTYYNEINPTCVLMLKQLIKDGFISDGEVDGRSICDVKANEITKFKRHHFFAGIGMWDYALQLAGWEEDRPVCSGSSPCQPFSTAGKRKGKKDERHLWPYWFSIIRELKPPTIFGEQVEGAIAYGWLDDVSQGLEAEGYSIGAAVLPACCVGAPHR